MKLLVHSLWGQKCIEGHGQPVYVSYRWHCCCVYMMFLITNFSFANQIGKDEDVGSTWCWQDYGGACTFTLCIQECKQLQLLMFPTQMKTVQ